MTSSPPLSPEVQHKKWLYQATHRGTKEADALVGGFVENFVSSRTLSPTECQEMEALLALSDEHILNFILKGAPLPPGHDIPLLEIMRRWAFTPR